MLKHIKVYDHNRIGPYSTPYEMDAWCVGGEEGICAFFIYRNRFCIAKGDDGTWNLIYSCDKDWFLKFQEVMSEIVYFPTKEALLTSQSPLLRILVKKDPNA